jgi:hypothetical protein
MATVTSGNEMTPAPSRPITRSSSSVALHGARRTPPRQRWSRRRGVTSVFAALAALAFAAAYIGPMGGAISQAQAEEVRPVSLYASALGDVQQLVTAESADEAAAPASLDRGGYTVYVTPKPTPTPTPTAKAARAGSSGGGWAPPFVTPDPGSAQAIAYDMVLSRGWNDAEFGCLVALWNRESGWRVNAYNKGSGAYGIPQSLPGSKMASAGADWETNPATQISWGLGYIGGRYGSPCGAWGHSESKGWY